MNNLDIAYQRLNNQRLAGQPFKTPEEVVRWLGIVQSQDYAGGKWAVALRTPGLTEPAIEQACSSGSILRTHVLRPTWHFVDPADIRWMLDLGAPQLRAKMAKPFRDAGLDGATLTRSNDVIGKALQGGQQLTRAEIKEVLLSAGIDASGEYRLGFILGHAEVNSIICSGAWRGKQPTWALLDDRVPEVKTLPRDEALAELARRYFTSHGPATLKDYMWWSGLNAGDARAGLDMAKAQLDQAEINEKMYWFAGSITPAGKPPISAHLLPNYDEYTVAYTDREAIYAPGRPPVGKLDSRGNYLFNYVIVINSQVVGTWKRTLKKKEVIIESTPFNPLTPEEEQAFEAAAQRYGDYLGLKAVTR